MCWAGRGGSACEGVTRLDRASPPSLPRARPKEGHRSFGLWPTGSGAVPLRTSSDFLQPLQWRGLGTLTHSEILSPMGQSLWPVPMEDKAQEGNLC